MCDNDTGNNGAVGGGNGHSKAHRPPHKARGMGKGKQMAMGERIDDKPLAERDDLWQIALLPPGMESARITAKLVKLGGEEVVDGAGNYRIYAKNGVNLLDKLEM